MRLRCRLREIRGDRPLRELESATGINRGELSRFERGVALPTEEQTLRLQDAYGVDHSQWYGSYRLVSMQTGLVAALAEIVEDA